jgi:hypothetical protein
MQSSVSFFDYLCPPRKPLQQIPPLHHPTLRFNAPETRIVGGGHWRPVGRVGRHAGACEGSPPAHHLPADQEVLLAGEKVDDGQAGEEVEHVVTVASAQPFAANRIGGDKNKEFRKKRVYTDRELNVVFLHFQNTSVRDAFVAVTSLLSSQ